MVLSLSDLLDDKVHRSGCRDAATGGASEPICTCDCAGIMLYIYIYIHAFHYSYKSQTVLILDYLRYSETVDQELTI